MLGPKTGLSVVRTGSSTTQKQGHSSAETACSRLTNEADSGLMLSHLSCFYTHGLCHLVQPFHIHPNNISAKNTSTQQTQWEHKLLGSIALGWAKPLQSLPQFLFLKLLGIFTDLAADSFIPHCHWGHRSWIQPRLRERGQSLTVAVEDQH